MSKKRVDVTCAGCGRVNWVALADTPARSAPLVTLPPRRPRTQDENETVDIPFQHAVHLSIPVWISWGALSVVKYMPPQTRGIVYGFVAASVVFVFVRAVTAFENWHELGWKFEQLVRLDLNRDGVVGEPPPQPRHTAIDEIDERHQNGAPLAASLTWLPISPEETQRLAVALLADDVRLVRQDLIRAGALGLNDYKAVTDALKERRMVCKMKNRNRLTYAGYKWLCKKLPRGITPLPYTSLR